MIRIKNKAAAPIPLILQTDGVTATGELTKRYSDGERNFSSDDFKSSIYGNTEVKESLKLVQEHKCCFCESKISHISYGDVEHFRPKAGWVQDGEALNRPGYYWVAYEWDNLLLSCQICNQRHKKNLFPLLAGSIRAVSHHDDVSNEQTVFLHPANEDVEDFITFKEEIPISVNGNERGSISISKLGLDRELLNERRRDKLGMIRSIYNLAKGYPDTYPELRKGARDEIVKYQVSSHSDATEYASMLRSFFRDNPINF